MMNDDSKWYDNFKELPKGTLMVGYELTKMQIKMVENIYPKILESFDILVDDFEIYIEMKSSKSDFSYFGNIVCYKFPNFKDFLIYLNNRSLDIVEENKNLEKMKIKPL